MRNDSVIKWNELSAYKLDNYVIYAGIKKDVLWASFVKDEDSSIIKVNYGSAYINKNEEVDCILLDAGKSELFSTINSQQEIDDYLSSLQNFDYTRHYVAIPNNWKPEITESESKKYITVPQGWLLKYTDSNTLVPQPTYSKVLTIILKFVGSLAYDNKHIDNYDDLGDYNDQEIQEIAEIIHQCIEKAFITKLKEHASDNKPLINTRIRIETYEDYGAIIEVKDGEIQGEVPFYDQFDREIAIALYKDSKLISITLTNKKDSQKQELYEK